jgi:hypothetical protein
MSSIQTLETANHTRFHIARCPDCDVIVQDTCFTEEPHYWQVKLAISIDIVKSRSKGASGKPLEYSVHLVYLTPAYKARSVVWTFEEPEEAAALELFLKAIQTPVE